MAPVVPPPGKRGPPASACDLCRARRIACRRRALEDTGGVLEACEACAKRGVECQTVAVRQAKTRRRTARPAASTTPASAGPSSSSAVAAASLSLTPSGASSRLTSGELSESFGFELLTLYENAGSGSSDALYPPPVVDFLALKQRYEAAGKRLSALSPEDQLTCRIVFASASRLWTPPSASSPDVRPRVVQQLLAAAQSHADGAAVWRQPSAKNATSLLLLFQLVGQGEIAGDEVQPYLSSLVGQLKSLSKRDPAVVYGPSGESVTTLTWSVLAFDTLAAVERGEAPNITKADYARLLGPFTPSLPSIATLTAALAAGPWPLTNALLLPLASYVVLGRRVAFLLDEAKATSAALRNPEVEEIWGEASSLVEWAEGALSLAHELEALEVFSLTILQLYTNLACGAALFAQLAILRYLEGLPSSLASEYAVRFACASAAHLRSIRASGRINFLAVFTGSAWSVTRLVDFAQRFWPAAAWDAELFPKGPEDKLSSLKYLHEALDSVSRSYPSPDLSNAIRAVETEKAALAAHVACSSIPTASAELPAVTTLASAVTAPLVSSAPSLTAISAWTHVRDGQDPEGGPAGATKSAPTSGGVPPLPTFHSPNCPCRPSTLSPVYDVLPAPVSSAPLSPCHLSSLRPFPPFPFVPFATPDQSGAFQPSPSHGLLDDSSLTAFLATLNAPAAPAPPPSVGWQVSTLSATEGAAPAVAGDEPSSYEALLASLVQGDGAGW